MATSPTVFEVMIHCVEADAESALRLQQRLRKDGIRAGIAGLSEVDLTRNAQIARHSLCCVGESFGEKDLIAATHHRFDSVFISPGAELVGLQGETSSCYETLIERMNQPREGATISALELRRMTQASYDAIAGQFTDVWYDSIPGEAIGTFLRHLPRGGTILDAGCGPGHHARFFKKEGFCPVGLDFSRGMLEVAVAKNTDIPFERGDILSHALPPAYFDAVWSAVMLNHVPAEELTLALGNLVATLKLQGHIGLNFQIGRQSEIVSMGRDHRFFEYPGLSRIRQTLEALGVSIVSTHFGFTTKNIHSLDLEMRFVTVVGQKLGTI